MTSLFKKMVSAAALSGAMLAAVPAEARHGGYDGYRSYDGYRGYRGDGNGYRGYRGGRGYYSAPRSYGYGYGYRDYRPYRGYRHGYYNDRSGDIVAAGIVGLALGAVIASASRSDRYDRRDRYYDDYYGY